MLQLGLVPLAVAAGSAHVKLGGRSRTLTLARSRGRGDGTGFCDAGNKPTD